MKGPRRLALIAALLVAFTAGCGGGSTSSPGTDAQSPTGIPSQQLDTEAVAYQMSPSHTGVVKYSTPVAFPSRPSWNVVLGQYTSYPLIVNGRVYVVSSIATPSAPNVYGVYLYAFDATNGSPVWGPVAVNGTYVQSNLAYDNGRLFVTNFEGLVRAYDAATGSELWSSQLDGSYASSASPPTALNGFVYVGQGHGFVYGLDQTTGIIRWQQSVEYGADSSPAVTSDGVYVTYPCRYYRLNPKSGEQMWLRRLSCNGGGGFSPAVNKSHVFLRDDATGPNGQMLDVSTGALTKAYWTDTSPAVTDSFMYFVSNGVLSAMDLSTQMVLWNFSDPGGNAFISTVILINDDAIVETGGGRVYAIDVTTGAQVWVGDAGSTIRAADPPLAIPQIAAASAHHVLVIPTDSGLTAWSLTP